MRRSAASGIRAAPVALSRAHAALATLYAGMALGLIAMLLAWDERTLRAGGAAPAVLLGMGVMAALHAVIALALRQCPRVGRAASLGVSAVMLAAVPVGTCVGVWLLALAQHPPARRPRRRV